MKVDTLLVIVALLVGGLGCSPHNQTRRTTDGDTMITSSVGERCLIRSLEEELGSSQEIEAKLANLVEAIRHSNEREAGLLALLGERLETSDVLVSCLRSIDLAVDMTIENLSNAQTYGYKKIRAVFDGETIAGARRILTQGTLHRTDVQLDLAIVGPGFFEIEMPNGEVTFTRHGQFSRNWRGEIVTIAGYRVVDTAILPDDPSTVRVSQDGTLSTVGPDGVINQKAQIHLAVFTNPEELTALGNMLFKPTEVSGVPVISNPGTHGAGTIRQGFLEGSNVNVTEELQILHTLQTWKNGLERAILAIHGHDGK